MSAVWVVRKNGKVEAAFPREDEALNYRNLYGAADITVTRIVTRETILTPAHAAVIEAAVASFHDTETSAMELERALEKAVAILRKQEAET